MLEERNFRSRGRIGADAVTKRHLSGTHAAPKARRLRAEDFASRRDAIETDSVCRLGASKKQGGAGDVK